MKRVLRRSHLLGAAILVLLAAIAGAVAFKTMQQTDNTASLALPAETVLQLNTMHLPDQNGVAQNFAQWKGKIRVINFWATWCPPCREEMPAFFRLQTQFGVNSVQFVGIALDLAANVRKYADESHPTYPLLIGNIIGADLATALGNSSQGLPYTVILDGHDQVVLRHIGPIAEEKLDNLLKKALASHSSG